MIYWSTTIGGGPRRAAIAIVVLSLVVGPRAVAEPTTFGSVERASALLADNGTTTSSLGSFNIVINAGAALAANVPALNAFNRAAARWEQYISDPITVDINANLASLGSGIIGQANSASLIGAYSSVSGMMVADSAGEDDDAIVDSLPGNMTFTMPSGFSQGTYLGLPAVSLTKANAKALGFSGLPAGPDGTITFSTSFSFDFDNSNGVTAGLTDFETVAVHEIGHILGFVSDVDWIDTRASSANVLPTPLDMFRFDNDGATDPSSASDFANFPRSMIPGNDEVFDQVFSELGVLEGRMSTGVAKGDGRQASHWKDNNLTGILIGAMDPTLATEQVFQITAADLRALDLIGYDIAAVPEAGAWAFAGLATGASGLGCWAKRRRPVP